MSLTVVMRNLPLDATNEEVSALLWTTVGINANPKNMRTTAGTFSKQAFIPITAEDMCEFLCRNFQDTLPLPQQKAAPYFVPTLKPSCKVTVDQVTVTFPTNRNGVRKL
jgi:hypothetical protein